MPTDANPSSNAVPAAPVPTVVVAVNQPARDSGLRVPVERVALDEVERRQHGAAAEPALPSHVGVLHSMIVELRQALVEQHQRVAELQQTLDALMRRLHRTPRDAWSAHQPPLFPEVQANPTTPPDPAPPVPPDSAESPPADNATPEQPRPKPASKHGRRSLETLLKSLPLERREHPLTEAERLCPCCGRPRRKIGEQTTQQLEYVPAKLVCVQHVQFTYSCPHCPEHITTAPKPPQPIDRGLPGPGLCALVTAGKLDDYLPLYRQELIHARAGLFLARSTLCDWMRALSQLVQPLVEHMRQDLFRSRVVQTDGTSIAVLMEGERQTRTGYFWPYLGDAAHPHVVVDFSLDKRKLWPQQFLADYAGYVQVDAYSAYDGCFLANTDSSRQKIEVGCWSHAERYFTAASPTDPSHAAEGLGFIRSLFALEADAQRNHLGETEVLALRQGQAVPILDAFHIWLERTRDEVLPKSPLADAVRYTLNQWAALRRYTETGFLSIDNNANERINKLIARGRVNWLFVGSPRGGETAARLLSLVVTCRRLHMDSFLYLRDVFTRLPGLPAARLEELVPCRWLEAHPEARHPPERQGRGHGDPRPRRRRPR
jgi:transposase